MASRQRLALRGRVRVLSPAARDGPPPRRRRHLAQVDDQPLSDPVGAARLAGVSKGTLFLLRERSARLCGIARTLRGRREQGDRAAHVLLGRVLRAHVGDASADRRRHPRHLRRAPARRPRRDDHLRGDPRLPPPPRPRRVHPPAAPDRRRNTPSPLRPGAARHLAARVCVSPALRVDAADRARQPPRSVGPSRHRGVARRARARVLRRGRAPGVGRRARLPLPRLRAAQGEARRARLVGAQHRGALTLRALSRRVAWRHRGGDRLLPRPEDHPPGLEPRARLSGGLRVPRVPQEALPRRAALEPGATLALPEGSWGEGGDHRVWLNRDTEWTWDRVYSAEAEWAAHLAATRAAKNDLARALAQATRELLLLQASDWQFLITTGTARDYAERRVAEHYAEFKRLSEMARGLASGEPLSPDDANSLRRLEREDFCFPDLEPAWGMGPPGEG